MANAQHVAGTFRGKPFVLRQSLAAGVVFWDVQYEGRTYPLGPVFRDETDAALRERIIKLLESRLRD
jgi:hypothetical protein